MKSRGVLAGFEGDGVAEVFEALDGASAAAAPVAARLADAPRPGTPARITAEQVCRVLALACEAPGASGRPSSPWSTPELAAEIVQRGIVARLSPRHAARLLTRGTSGRTGSAPG